MTDSNSPPLSEHRTSEIGFVPSSSPTPRPNRRARNLSSVVHPNAPPTKRQRQSQALHEEQREVQSDDLPDSSTLDPPLRSSPPPFPFSDEDFEVEIDEDDRENDTIDDNDNGGGQLYTKREMDAMTAKIRERGSLIKYLRTAMWRKEKYYGVTRGLTALLQEEENPYICSRKYAVVQKILNAHKWEPVKVFLRGEVVTFGKEVVKKFEEPVMNDPDMELDDQLQFLERDGRCRESAPVFFDILASCSLPLRNPAKRRIPWAALTMMVAQLAYMAAPRMFNRLAVSLGMILSHYHLTKRGLDTLNALGITASYKSVNAQTKKIQATHTNALKELAKRMLNRCVLWDNLYRVNNVQETRAGDEKEQMNVTTGMIKLCRSISPSGLRQSLLNWGHALTVQDILPSSSRPGVADQRAQLTEEVRV